MGRYDGKVALITGAAGGIGGASALRLASEGANLVLTDLAAASVEPVAEKARGQGVQALTLAVDVSREEDLRNAVSLAEEKLGGLDLLVNNAGIEGVVASFEDYPLEVFDQVMAVNVRGVFLGIRCAVPALRRRGGGAIVNLSSVAGLTGAGPLSAYNASKHAVIGLTRAAASGYGGEGIRVNAVCPSPVETRMMRSLEQGMGGEQPELVKKGIAESIPLGRYAEPEEIAGLIAFLGSADAAFIHGSIYTIDGGMTPI